MRYPLLGASLLALLAACENESQTSSPKPTDDLVLDEDAEGLVGQRGYVQFEVRPEGDRGARASFRFLSAGGARPKSQAPDAPVEATLEVRVFDEFRAELTYTGTTLDGNGPLAEREREALRSLADHTSFDQLALIPLDVACATGSVQPRLLAALLFPWQAALKYLSPDREQETRARAEAASCRHFSSLDDTNDPRPRPLMPLLANGQAVPRAYGYLPFDDQGELETTAAKRQKALVEPDQNVFGPGQSMCRGACGPDCEETNCGEPKDEWRCVQQEGRNTGEKERWKRYTCGEHEGCIEHDACFDQCNGVFGVGSWDANLCMRGCDLQAAAGHGAVQGIEWALGHGPFTREKTYDYATGERVRDEQLCPLAFSLSAVPSSGLAPFATKIVWTGDLNDPGEERCRLDLGDGTPPVDIEPCPASGEYEHIYGVPSEMRSASGVYHVSLTRIGAAQTQTTDVQVRFRFEADPATGKAPLLTGFRWDGFALVTKPLTCTLDFGDGSAPVLLEDCAKKPGVTHEYAQEGLYVASLTVRGEDRPVTKTLSIEVSGDDDPPAECEQWRDIESWSATANFSYSASANDGELSVTHVASGIVHGSLSVSSKGQYGMTFWDLNPTGNVSISEVALDLGPNADNPHYQIEGSGTPLPPVNGPDSGSNILLNFDLVDCRYNVHVQAMVAGTYTSGDESHDAEPWVVSLQSPWLPLPSSGTLSFAGAYAAHSESYILTSPDLEEYYWVMNYDLIDMLGEGGLGSAQVSWQLTPK